MTDSNLDPAIAEVRDWMNGYERGRDAVNGQPDSWGVGHLLT